MIAEFRGIYSPNSFSLAKYKRTRNLPEFPLLSWKLGAESSSHPKPFTMPYLRLVSDERECTYEFDGSELWIGRESHLAVILQDKRVSRRHARIFREDDHWYVADNGSSWGTELNGESLQPGQAKRILPGDILRIVNVLVYWELASPTVHFNPPADPGVSSSSVTFRDNFQGRIEARHGPEESQSPPSIAVRQLDGILRINRALTGGAPMEESAKTVLQTLFEIFPGCDQGALLQLNSSPLDPRVVCAVSRHTPGDESTSVAQAISRTILKYVISERTGLLFEDTDSDERTAASESVAARDIRSAMCVPMLDHTGEPFGVISVEAHNLFQRFNLTDLAMLSAISSQVSHAFENSRLQRIKLLREEHNREMLRAAIIQKALIPRQLPESKVWSIAGVYDAAREVGGDYYDCFEIPENKLCLCFGDVAGKGVPAALIMSRLSGLVRSVLSFTDNVALATERINDLLANFIPEDKFVTCILGVLDSTQHTFRFVNCGHAEPLLRQMDGIVTPVCSNHPAFALGMFPGLTYSETCIHLNRGETILLRTDGVEEGTSSDNQQFGIDRMLQLLSDSGGEPETVCHQLLRAVKTFMPPDKQSDDIAIVAFRRNF